MLNIISKLLLLSSFALLASCAGLPPDEPMCTEINMTEGFCVHWISGKSFTINEDKKYNGKTWWELRPTMILVPSSSYKNIKPWIIKVCKKHEKQCQQEVSSWERTLNIIDTNLIKDNDEKRNSNK